MAGLAKPDTIVLASCSTGAGGKTGKNLANALATWFPEVEIFAPMLDATLPEIVVDRVGHVEQVYYMHDFGSAFEQKLERRAAYRTINVGQPSDK